MRRRSHDTAVRTGGGWLIPLLLLLVVGSLVGLSTVLATLAGRAGVGTGAFLAWSLSAAGVALVIAAGLGGDLPARGGHLARYVVIAAALTLVVPNLVLFSAIAHVGAAFVAVALASPPLWTYLGALALGMERLQVLRAAGVVVTLAGSTVLAALQLGQPDAEVVWVALVLAAPLVLAAGNLYRSLDWPPAARPAGLAAGMVATAGAVLLAAGAIVPGMSLAVPLAPGALSVIGAQAAVFAALYRLFFVLQQRGGPVYLSLIGSVAAVVGASIAILALGETVPPGLAPGGALVLAGVTLLTLGAARRTSPSHAPRATSAATTTTAPPLASRSG